MNAGLYFDAALGASSLLASGYFAHAVARDLRAHHRGRLRSRAKGMNELLRWGLAVDDGVIVNKDSALMMAWQYTGKDAATLTAAERHALAEQLNAAFTRLGTGWLVHFDAVRRKAPPYRPWSFPDWLTQAIDDERRKYFDARDSAYESEFFVTLTYLPPASMAGKGARLIFGEGAQALKTFRETAHAFARELPLSMRPLKRRSMALVDGTEVQVDDFYTYLHHRVTGEHHPIRVPDGIAEVDALVGAVPFEHGHNPRVGDKTVQVVSVEGFPVRNLLGQYDILGELVGEYVWTTRFMFLDQHEAKKRLEDRHAKWVQKVIPFWDKLRDRDSGRRDKHALAMAADTESAITDIASRARAGGLYTSTITVMDEDPETAARQAREICQFVRTTGLSAARVEDINTTEAFLGSLPGHGTENLRRLQINTRNLADLMPSSSIYAGAKTAPCPMYPADAPPLMHVVAQGRTPYRYNCHSGDLGNTAVLGPPGSGKSTFLSILAAQLRRYEGMSVFAFDKGNSLYALASGIWAATEGGSGLHFDVGTAEGLSFAPLEHLETTADIVWALDWLDTLLALNGVQSTPGQRNTLGQELKRMHERGGVSLTDLAATVQDRQIQEVLQTYTADGTAGLLLDAEHDGLALSDFTVFEIEHLMALQDKFALPVLLYLFRRIERSLTGAPAAIILDEAWLMLGHPVFRKKIWEWLKTMRKANCIVIMATQSLADVSESGIFEQLKEALGSQVFLSNPNARSPEGRKIYTSMGLGAQDIERIASGKPKRDYYHVTPEGKRQFELAAGPLTLAFCGASSKGDISTIRALRDSHGFAWPRAWVAHRLGNKPAVTSRKSAGEAA